MNYRNLTAYILVGILLNLVSTIEVEITFPSLAFGSTAQAPIKEVIVYKTAPQPAVYMGAPYESNTIILVGDVLLARNVESLMKKHGESYPYLGVNFSKVATNPYVVGNFEATVPKVHVPTEALKMNFSVDAKYLQAAKDSGFTHFSLANNHSFDNAEEGFLSTIDKLNGADLVSFGNPKKISRDSVSFINLQKTTVAIVGIHALEEQPTQAELNALLTYANSKSDFQLIYIHWGTEYDVLSSSVQKKLAKRLVDAGADIIVGHHPHVVQEVSVIDGVPVFYSLGNYIFDQYSSKDTQEGLLLSLDFSSEPIVNLVPVTSQYTISQPMYMLGREKDGFLTDLARRSDSEIKQYIEYGVIPLRSLVATSSKIAIMSR